MVGLFNSALCMRFMFCVYAFDFLFKTSKLQINCISTPLYVFLVVAYSLSSLLLRCVRSAQSRHTACTTQLTEEAAASPFSKACDVGGRVHFEEGGGWPVWEGAHPPEDNLSERAVGVGDNDRETF